MSSFKCGGLSLVVSLRTPPPQISWVSAGKQGELQRRQGLPTPSPAGAPTLAPALTRSSNEFYLSCGVLSATTAVQWIKQSGFIAALPSSISLAKGAPYGAHRELSES